MEPMTLDEARGFLAAAVSTQGPEFIYNTGESESDICSYIPLVGLSESDPRTKTGCLVGVALSLAGRSRENLEEFAGSVLFAEEPFSLTSEAAGYFHRAQREQDIGTSWGYAFQVAEDWADSRV